MPRARGRRTGARVLGELRARGDRDVLTQGAGQRRGRLLPDTYSVLAARFDALAPERLDDASALLDRLLQLDPDSSTTHLQRASCTASTASSARRAESSTPPSGANRSRGASWTTAHGC